MLVLVYCFHLHDCRCRFGPPGRAGRAADNDRRAVEAPLSHLARIS